MARQIRIAFENASYHIMARGNEKRPIFYGNRDRWLFLKTLAEMVQAYDILLHSYALMPNHYHLACTTPHGNLSQALGWLQTTYSVRFNKRHARVGHLFQGRFKAILVEAEAYATQLIHYHHLNIVRPADKNAIIPYASKSYMEQYPWSSYQCYAGLRAFPAWLDLSWLSFWGSTLAAAQIEYRRDIDRCFGEPAWDPQHHLTGGLLLGSEGFCERMGERIHAKGNDEEVRWTQREYLENVRRRITPLLSVLADQRLQIWLRVRLGHEEKSRVASSYGYKSRTTISKIIRALEGSASRQQELQSLREMVLGSEFRTHWCRVES